MVDFQRVVFELCSEVSQDSKVRHRLLVERMLDACTNALVERFSMRTYAREVLQRAFNMKQSTQVRVENPCEPSATPECEVWKLRALTEEPYVGVTGPRWDQHKRMIWRWG